MSDAKIEKKYLAARNAITDFYAALERSDDATLADVEHKFWALSMYADEGMKRARSRRKTLEAA